MARRNNGASTTIAKPGPSTFKEGAMIMPSEWTPPNPQEHETPAIVINPTNIQVESNTQIHGLYEEDLREGICCSRCAYMVPKMKRSYEQVVSELHGFQIEKAEP